MQTAVVSLPLTDLLLDDILEIETFLDAALIFAFLNPFFKH